MFTIRFNEVPHEDIHDEPETRITIAEAPDALMAIVGRCSITNPHEELYQIQIKKNLDHALPPTPIICVGYPDEASALKDARTFIRALYMQQKWDGE